MTLRLKGINASIFARSYAWAPLRSSSEILTLGDALPGDIANIESIRLFNVEFSLEAELPATLGGGDALLRWCGKVIPMSTTRETAEAVGFHLDHCGSELLAATHDVVEKLKRLTRDRPLRYSTVAYPRGYKGINAAPDAFKDQPHLLLPSWWRYAMRWTAKGDPKAIYVTA
ncbi:MAG: hypothetical protein M1813_006976 [Trichoglossum hirsutum]|jgi:hypothetical protein|nr:MAG: hypothetical protein M1813_006976 [Trichoglossum hirsutum]